MLSNIALVTAPVPEVAAIRKRLKNALKYNVKEFLSLDEVNQGLATFPFDLLILRLAVFQSAQVATLAKIRARFPHQGLISVSPEIHPSARFQVRDFSRHKLLSDPGEIDDLPQVVGKLLLGGSSTLRMHPRVRRVGECEVVDMSSGQRSPGQFVDFAQMGARLNVQPKIPFKRNTRVELTYRSTSDPGRIHRIESNVVWAEISSGIVETVLNGAQQSIGLRFVAAL